MNEVTLRILLELIQNCEWYALKHAVQALEENANSIILLKTRHDKLKRYLYKLKW